MLERLIFHIIHLMLDAYTVFGLCHGLVHVLRILQCEATCSPIDSRNESTALTNVLY